MKKIFLISVILFSLKGFAQQTCDDKKLPIIFVHGFLASGDSWATQIQRLIKSGYCEERLFVFDWNTIGEEKSDSLLEVFIRKVLIKTNAQSVNLIAHSAGGGVWFPF
jgi:triacylglycerol esterase/lipase EstA (alpha/beta hydrolase family)